MTVLIVVGIVLLVLVIALLTAMLILIGDDGSWRDHEAMHLEREKMRRVGPMLPGEPDDAPASRYKTE